MWDGEAGGPVSSVVLGGLVAAEEGGEAGLLEVVVAGESLGEAAGSGSATLQLSAVSGLDVSVPFTVGGDAVDPDDYALLTATPALIPAGQTSVPINLSLVADALHETDETLILTLIGAEVASLGATSEVTLSIGDNDAPPLLSFATDSALAAEGAGSLSI